jgi:hypothetical protein
MTGRLGNSRPCLPQTWDATMTTGDSTNTTVTVFSIEALRFRILATEADLNALMAFRTNADAIQRTEANYRGLIVKLDRYRRLVRQLVRRLEVAQ